MAKIINMNIPTAKLIKQAKKNNRRAQKQLYDLYSPALLGICRLYISDLQFAEDVMVKAFHKILINIKNYDERNHFFAWMRKITVNECINFLRSKINQYSFQEWEGNEKTVIASSELNTMAEEEVQSFIDVLPEGCRTVFNLYVFEELSHKEIAECLGVSIGTSKSQLAYAKKILKSKINKESLYAK